MVKNSYFLCACVVKNANIGATLSTFHVISLQSESMILNVMVTIIKLDVIKRWEEGLCSFLLIFYI